jgi:hypothetical protein
MSDLSLLARVEALTGPDRDIDAEIFIEHSGEVPANAGRVDSLHGMVGWWPIDAPYESARDVPRYTGSTDAALALADKVLPRGFLWSVSRPPEGKKKRKRKSDDVPIPFDGYVATDDRIGEKSHRFAIVEHVSPALAIILAVLQAKSLGARP